jgi:replicative DNA helicase
MGTQQESLALLCGTLGVRKEPHDLDAERAVLGTIILSTKAAATVLGKLDVEDFFLDHHKHVFRAATSLFTAGKPIDLVTLSSELESMKVLDRVGGQVFVAEILDAVPTAANAEHYATIVRDLSSRRALILAGEKTVSLAQDTTRPVGESFDQSQSAIYQAWKHRMSENSVTASQAYQETWELIASLTGKPSGLETGFYDLDAKTGGFHGGELILLAARPGVGKTALALNMTAHVAMNVGVGFFSLEMSANQLMSRLIAGRAGIDHLRVQKGDLNSAEWVKVSKTAPDLSALKFIIEEAARLSTVELKARSMRLKMTQGIGMIVVDYLQLMDAPKMDSRTQEVTEISRSLKALARELDVPVIACAQLNRRAEERADKRPQLSDLRESGALEQDADIVLLMHRPSLYDNRQPDEAEIIIAKHRNGPTGIVKLLFRPELVRFLNPVKGNSPGASIGPAGTI